MSFACVIDQVSLLSSPPKAASAVAVALNDVLPPPALL
jgi:hypothetical protein